MHKGTVLGLDFGEKRIGVALGEPEVGIATPLETIRSEVNDVRFAAIGKLVAEWKVTGFVVGLPCHMDGGEHQLTALSRKFAQRLQGRYKLPVWLVDERLTSVIAEGLLEEAGVYGRRQKEMLDQVAAQAILMGWFEQPGEPIA
ncbi:Holliday junction resolvase RuvX [Vogesella sp. LIG4]|uniref:Holliday junction resolvase RuvX n=1 Tax=Vogesella sp. LIG4 TaxID=1192162 RepID=UPI00081FBDCD|nr:Holliday junction resolvase RuvX [Vogesella sp. LIG4]SCK16255.1 putative holliday junction resolvase [Vogesella sp. LIG4]